MGAHEQRFDDQFQSTLPRGERQKLGQVAGRVVAVSIHAPARGATPRCRWCHLPAPCFNPRSRAGSDLLKQELFLEILFVSIHAPARGATETARAAAHTVVVSIHAPARGATTTMAASSSPAISFNPRSRAGSDTSMLVEMWGSASFNPRSRAGSDLVTLPSPPAV